MVLKGSFESPEFKYVTLKYYTDTDELRPLWAERSLNLVIKDQNPFRTDNSVHSVTLRPMQNTVAHVNVLLQLNRVRKPSRWYPYEESMSFMTYSGYSIDYRNLANRIVKNRPVLVISFVHAFDVKVERQ